MHVAIAPSYQVLLLKRKPFELRLALVRKCKEEFGVICW